MNQKKLGEALGRRGGGLRKQSRRGSEYGFRVRCWSYISGISQDDCEKYCGLPGRKRQYLQIAKQLLKVAKLGPKAFEQCAGFLRISGRQTIRWMRPAYTRRAMRRRKASEKAGLSAGGCAQKAADRICRLTIKDYKKLAEELGIGEITLRDIVKELEKPGSDPQRGDAEADPAHGCAGNEGSESRA